MHARQQHFFLPFPPRCFFLLQQEEKRRLPGRSALSPLSPLRSSPSLSSRFLSGANQSAAGMLPALLYLRGQVRDARSRSLLLLQVLGGWRKGDGGREEVLTAFPDVTAGGGGRQAGAQEVCPRVLPLLLPFRHPEAGGGVEPNQAASVRTNTDTKRRGAAESGAEIRMKSEAFSDQTEQKQKRFDNRIKRDTHICFY